MKPNRHTPPVVKKISGSTVKRVLGMLFKFYPVLFPLTIFCIIFAAVTSSIPSLFMQDVFATIDKYVASGDWSTAAKEIVPTIILLASLYVVSALAITTQTQLMAYMTQGFLSKMRCKMFDGMQNLPIKYFDQNKHGDIMSHYTNDIDTLRQLISQAIPSLIQAIIIVSVVFFIMLGFSVWMTLVVLCGVVLMLFVSKTVGGGSAKYFIRQQKSMGKTEGYIQEMMNGQKVVKVFCHENETQKGFDEINNQLFEDAYRANAYANCLGPIIMNIGNILYVLVAVAGGLFLITNTKNLGIFGMPFSISIIVPFLNMTKQFTGNINQVSQQFNAVAMGMAGAERIFSLMDREAEADEGYVTLVNCEIDKDGNIK